MTFHYNQSLWYQLQPLLKALDFYSNFCLLIKIIIKIVKNLITPSRKKSGCTSTKEEWLHFHEKRVIALPWRKGGYTFIKEGWLTFSYLRINFFVCHKGRFITSSSFRANSSLIKETPLSQERVRRSRLRFQSSKGNNLKGKIRTVVTYLFPLQRGLPFQ